MDRPRECPTPLGQTCPHSGKMEVQQANMLMILDRLTELREDMKQLKESVAAIAVLEQGHAFHKQALERAFDKIKELEHSTSDHNNTLNQFKGMTRLAVGLWTVLASGLGVVIIKVFEVVK